MEFHACKSRFTQDPASAYIIAHSGFSYPEKRPSQYELVAKTNLLHWKPETTIEDELS
jgi:hypothetical protein